MCSDQRIAIFFLQHKIKYFRVEKRHTASLSLDANEACIIILFALRVYWWRNPFHIQRMRRTNAAGVGLSVCKVRIPRQSL